MREGGPLSTDILLEIRDALAQRRYAFTVHAVHQAEERTITPVEVEEAILADSSEIIEDYPDDPRGPSCLILVWTLSRRPLHVQSSYPPMVFVITVYEPSDDRWIGYRTRRD